MGMAHTFGGGSGQRRRTGSEPQRAKSLRCLEGQARCNGYQNENRPKRAFRSDFVKLGSEILYLFLEEKWSFVVFFFVAMLCPILAYLKNCT